MDGIENNSFEMQNNDSNEDTVQPTEDAPETKLKEPSLDEIDPFSRALVLTRAAIFNRLKRNSRRTRIIIPAVIHGLALAHFIGAIVHHFKKNDQTINWCEDLGIMIIVEGIIYATMIYYAIKRRFGEFLYQLIFRHIGSFIHRLWQNRLAKIGICLIPVIAFGIFLGLDIEPGGEKRLISLLGVVVFMIFGFVFSKYPGHIQWRPVFCGLLLQFIFGFLTVRWSVGREVMSCMGDKVTIFQSYTTNGTSFVYGTLITDPKNGNIFAFATLSVIFFFSFVINILSYYGALQWFIMKLGWMMMKIMGTTVCESVNAAACIFLGMTESPLLFRGYITDLTKSEIHAIMCGGWATIAGTVMAAYIAFGVDPAHLIAATLMSAPASLCYAKLFYPETEVSRNTISNIVLAKEEASNVLDAACKGAISATELVFGIIANIIAFLAFVAFLDGFIHWLGEVVGADDVSFQFILSKIFIPVSYLMGVDTESLEDVAVLVGTKTVVNEFQAYQLMMEMVKQGKFSKRTEAITTYALCGFSNFSSIGILIGSLSTMAPSQRNNITAVAIRGFIAANIVCFLTACIAGTLITD